MPRDLEKRRLSNKASRERHKEHYLQHMKEYRASHKEQEKEYRVAYYEQNKDHTLQRGREYHQKYYQEHHEQELARRRKYRSEHKEQELADRVRRHNAQRRTLRDQILDILGRKCVRCGYDTDVRALQIDHVNGGGSQERKKLVFGIPYYRRILECVQANSGEYQVLCANCNVIKRMEEKEHGKRASE
jgi:hypothetical protein